MLKNRIEKLEEQSKKKSYKHQDFNDFYEGLKIGDVDTVDSFDGFYNENKKPSVIKEKLSIDDLKKEIIKRGLPILALDE